MYVCVSGTPISCGMIRLGRTLSRGRLTEEAAASLAVLVSAWGKFFSYCYSGREDVLRNQVEWR